MRLSRNSAGVQPLSTTRLRRASIWVSGQAKSAAVGEDLGGFRIGHGCGAEEHADGIDPGQMVQPGLDEGDEGLRVAAIAVRQRRRATGVFALPVGMARHRDHQARAVAEGEMDGLPADPGRAGDRGRGDVDAAAGDDVRRRRTGGCRGT